RSAAMAHRVAIGDLLVLVRLHEQPRPWPAEDRLQVRFDARPLIRSQAAVEQAPVVIGSRGHVERALLAAFDLEARYPRGPQRRQMVRQGEVLHRKRKALARIALHRRAVAERQRRALDFVAISAGISALAAIAAAAHALRRKQAQSAVRITYRPV